MHLWLLAERAELRSRLHVPGSQGQGGAQVTHRVFGAAESDQRISKVVMRFGVVALEVKRVLELHNGVLVLT